jgi:YVTN family beta-propeller protein
VRTWLAPLVAFATALTVGVLGSGTVALAASSTAAPGAPNTPARVAGLPGGTQFHVPGRDIDAGAATSPFAWMRQRARGIAQGASLPLGPADRGTILATVKLPDYANVALEGFGSMWVTVGSYQSTELVRIDLGTNAVTDVISLGNPVFGSPGELAISPDAVWVPKYYENEVDRIDPATDTIVARIPVGTSPVGAIYAFGSVWVANSHGASLSRIDPGTNTVIATVPAGYPGAMEAGPWQLAATSDAVWVDNGRPFFISAPKAKVFIQRVDPQTNTVTASLPAPKAIGCDTMTTVGSSLWLNDDYCGSGLSITRVDAEKNRIAQTVQIVDDPSGCIGGLDNSDGTLWAAVNRKLDPNLGFCGYAALERLDPSTGQVLATYGLGRHSLYNLSNGGGDLWTADGVRPHVLRIAMPSAGADTAPPTHGEAGPMPSASTSSIASPAPVAGAAGWPLEAGPAGGSVEARIRIRPGSFNPTYADGLIWTLSQFLDRYSYLVGVDPDTNTVEKTYFVGDSGAGLAFGDGSLWISKWYENTLQRIDPGTGEVMATIPTDLSPNGVLYYDGSVWVATHRGRAVDRIDPSSNQIIARIAAGDQQSFRSGPAGLAAGTDSVWVSAGNIGTVQKIDPATNQVVLTAQPIDPDIWLNIGSDAQSVYVFLNDQGYRLSQDTGEVTGTFSTDGNYGSMTMDGGNLWVSSDHLKDPNTGQTAAALTEYDPATLQKVTSIHVGGAAGDLLPWGDDEMWMSDYARSLLDRVALN